MFLLLRVCLLTLIPDCASRRHQKGDRHNDPRRHGALDGNREKEKGRKYFLAAIGFGHQRARGPRGRWMSCGSIGTAVVVLMDTGLATVDSVVATKQKETSRNGEVSISTALSALNSLRLF